MIKISRRSRKILKIVYVIFEFTCNILELCRCIKHLQKQDTPTGVELADDEFILHVEGTASSDRVVRHIGGTSWPGESTVFINFAVVFDMDDFLLK